MYGEKINIYNTKLWLALIAAPLAGRVDVFEISDSVPSIFYINFLVGN